ncbi:unnamed protein product [Bursaphelenchus okinawaensis]|uniref:Enoyl-CoA hydratase domain-containing protein 3, mitochondrial n=1 Tax=Bursaphelenchus okinawaensis TaxID=465554 RepID=A0A811LHU9_9BILA|nr:unnamed protein product [Bursaphelenchus okinawaensis]CAG9124103.1 unnamed protein product [Bursaphelenchus okinawaensis]
MSLIFRRTQSSSRWLSVRCCSKKMKKVEAPMDEPLGRELYLENQVVRFILNAPKNRNALSLELMKMLRNELEQVDKIQKVRAVILAGKGPAFSAGHDLRQLTDEKGFGQHVEIFSECTKLMSVIRAMQLPVIAEVSGIASAAGCQLVSTCDVVVASEESKFSVPGLKVGLFCSTPGIPLGRSISDKLAMDMLLTARAISAEEAKNAGLVSRVVPKDDVKYEALKVAEDVCNMSRSVAALGKAFYYAQKEMKLNDAYRFGEKVMTENLKLKDCQEGIDAFIEKRTAAWTHSDERVN